MKLTLQTEPGAQKEIVIRCETVDDEIRELMAFLSLRNRCFSVTDGAEMRLVRPGEVLYCESVDERTFVYTAFAVYRAAYSLSEIEKIFSELGFFRCSKSMVINIAALTSLKSGNNGRIIATLENGECILVSRRYAKELREKLKGG